MSASWFELFKRFGALRSCVYARWTMSNGAQFYFAIPSLEDVGEIKFSDNVEFPFTYAEIVSLEIFKEFGLGEHKLENDMTSVQSVFPIAGLSVVYDKERKTLLIASSTSS